MDFKSQPTKPMPSSTVYSEAEELLSDLILDNPGTWYKVEGDIKIRRRQPVVNTFGFGPIIDYVRTVPVLSEYVDGDLWVSLDADSFGRWGHVGRTAGYLPEYGWR